MSLITEVRTKADAAVRGPAGMVAGSARTTLDLAGNVINGAAGDVRQRVLSVTEGATANVGAVAATVTTTTTTLVGRSLKQARKQALATVGAGDFVVEVLTTRTEELTLEVQRNAGKGAATASARARSARARASATATSVRSRGGEVIDTVRTTERPAIPTAPDLRAALEARVGNVRDIAAGTLDQLAERGERVVRSVRRNPRLLDTETGVDHAAEDLADELSSLAGRVRYRAAAHARSVRAQKGAATRARSAASSGPRTTTDRTGHEPAVAVATAHRTAPAKSTAAKAPAGQSAAPTAASKATARKTTARKTTATPGTAARKTADNSTTRNTTARNTTAGKTAKTTTRKTTAP